MRQKDDSAQVLCTFLVASSNDTGGAAGFADPKRRFMTIVNASWSGPFPRWQEMMPKFVSGDKRVSQESWGKCEEAWAGLGRRWRRGLRSRGTRCAGKYKCPSGHKPLRARSEAESNHPLRSHNPTLYHLSYSTRLLDAHGVMGTTGLSSIDRNGHDETSPADGHLAAGIVVERDIVELKAAIQIIVVEAFMMMWRERNTAFYEKYKPLGTRPGTQANAPVTQ